MRTLTLLRHTKSSWDDPDLDDFARPLAERGRTAAPLIGSYCRQEGIKPDLIVASSAVRSKQTLALFLEALGSKPKTRFEKALYMAAPVDLLARIRKLPVAARHVMLVGHNPGLHALALDLIGEGAPAAIIALARKLPTGGLIVIEFPVENWSDVAPLTGRVTRFTTPKLLAG